MAEPRERIRALRARRGWTQQQLAECLGVDAVTVSRWERGAVTPRRGALTAVERLWSAPDESLEELVRIVGADVARKALRRIVLLRWRPAAVHFPVDPSARLKEVEVALAEQLDLVARAKPAAVGD
jgi:transcriptional regulator with XRE-family HTH domain